jgi:hypothetical protein
MLSLGVLLFSFGALLFGFKPVEDRWSFSFDKQHLLVPMVTMPNLAYWILGAIALGLSLFFLVISFREKLSKRVEEFVTEKAHFQFFVAWFAIYWLVYLGSFMNVVGKVISLSSPPWIVYLVFFWGLVVFCLIPANYFKELPKLKNKWRHPEPANPK